MSIPVEKSNETIKFSSYIIGFILSASLTLLAYVLAVNKLLDSWWLVGALLGLAVTQFAVQLLFFLHIGQEKKPRWKVFTLFLMLLFTLIVVLCSIWIIYNLNYRMMPMSRQEVNTYMKKQSESGL